MIEKFGRKGTEFEGIFFTEGPIDGGRVVGTFKEVSNRQNITLDELKARIAIGARKHGANCVDNFRYAQQATVFSFSSTRWTATGRYVRVDD